jgi:hypothetical protein
MGSVSRSVESAHCGSFDAIVSALSISRWRRLTNESDFGFLRFAIAQWSVSDLKGASVWAMSLTGKARDEALDYLTRFISPANAAEFAATVLQGFPSGRERTIALENITRQ